MLYVGSQKYKLYVGSERRMIVAPEPLPYDAEVEYLESTGTQYIDTGYTPIIGDSIHIEFTHTSYNIGDNYRCLYSAGTGTYQLIHLGCKSAAIDGAYYKYFASGGAAEFNYHPALNTWYALDVNGNGTATIDNYTCTSTPQNALDGNSTTLWLLLRRNNTSPFIGKIRRFWLENNGVRKIDYISVRVGQVGYMYDKVSKQLFGNSGTGSFTIGNDVN